jgi:hypothetical protein
MDNGRCRLHGGRNIDDKRPNLPGRPIVHGMRSKYARTKLSDKIQEFMEDQDFLSLREEIALMRSLLDEFMADREKFPADDIETITGLIDQIRRLNDTFIKIEAQRKFTLAPDDVIRIMKAIVEIIRRNVIDDVIYNKIRDEINSVRF